VKNYGSIPLERKVLSENDRIAASCSARFQEHGVLCLNFIQLSRFRQNQSSGVTWKNLPRHDRVPIDGGDIQTENDANRLKRFHFPVKTDHDWRHLPPRCSAMIERHLADWKLENWIFC